MKQHLTMDQVSQGLHICLGALFVLVPVAKHWGSFPRICGSGIAIVYAALKEGVYDQYFEDKETRGSGWRDFIHYIYGILAANVLLSI